MCVCERCAAWWGGMEEEGRAGRLMRWRERRVGLTLYVPSGKSWSCAMSAMARLPSFSCFSSFVSCPVRVVGALGRCVRRAREGSCHHLSLATASKGKLQPQERLALSKNARRGPQVLKTARACLLPVQHGRQATCLSCVCIIERDVFLRFIRSGKPSHSTRKVLFEKKGGTWHFLIARRRSKVWIDLCAHAAPQT